MYQVSPSRHCLTRTGVFVQWLLLKLSYVLGIFYAGVIGLSIPLVAYEYVVWLRPLLLLTLTSPALLLHTALALAFLLSATINFVAALFVRPGSPARTIDPEAGPPKSEVGAKSTSENALRTNSQMWRWCAPCKAPKPPRAHHCRMCDTCYLRHCHHCPALARCIGQNNYAYYWRFVATACTGTLYLAITCVFLLYRAPGVLPLVIRDLLFFTTVIAGSVSVAVSILLAWHIYLLCTGQTTIECYENWSIRRTGVTPATWTRWGGPFDKGFRMNIRDAFGDPPSRWYPWWSVLLVPWPRRFATGPISESTSY